MTGDILTPLTIWGDFKITSKPEAELIEEKTRGDVTLSRIKIDCRVTENGQVKAYGVIARKTGNNVLPAVLILSDVKNGLDESTAIELAKRGFLALAVDLRGKIDGEEYYTEYPDDISYANFSEANDGLKSIEGDATETCWYEWTAVAKYSAEFLKNQPCVNAVVGLGIGSGAGVLWQAVANAPAFSASAFVLDAGWKAYEKIYKFGDDNEPHFGDDVLKYVAGVDPASYAKHVKCPCLMLSATNSAEYDCDRAYDTVSRISEKAYRAVDYAVGSLGKIDRNALERISTFFGAFTDRENVERTVLPGEPEIKCDVSDGEIKIEVAVDKKGVEDVAVFASEQITAPRGRTWIKLVDGKKGKSGKYNFTYRPYGKSQIATFFAKATYQNGFSLCSNIIAKRFSENDVLASHKEKIIYTGRKEGAESAFTSLPLEGEEKVWLESDKNAVTVKKGPMSIDGVTAKGGLLTFKMQAEKYMPDDDALLMLDLFVKENSAFTVRLITDYFGERTVYSATQSVKGGKIWNNLKFEMAKFKTAEGRNLKSYQSVNAIEFSSDGEFLLNNVLWL